MSPGELPEPVSFGHPDLARAPSPGSPVIHHIAIEVWKDLLTEEREFWGLLGYAELRQPTRSMPKRPWLFNRRSGDIIQLNPIPRTLGRYTRLSGKMRPINLLRDYAHLCIVIEDARTITQLQVFGHEVTPVYVELETLGATWGGDRWATECPSGNQVELIERAEPATMGPPLGEWGEITE